MPRSGARSSGNAVGCDRRRRPAVVVVARGAVLAAQARGAAVEIEERVVELAGELLVVAIRHEREPGVRGAAHELRVDQPRRRRAVGDRGRGRRQTLRESLDLGAQVGAAGARQDGGEMLDRAEHVGVVAGEVGGRGAEVGGEAAIRARDRAVDPRALERAEEPLGDVAVVEAREELRQRRRQRGGAELEPPGVLRRHQAVEAQVRFRRREEIDVRREGRLERHGLASRRVDRRAVRRPLPGFDERRTEPDVATLADAPRAAAHHREIALEESLHLGKRDRRRSRGEHGAARPRLEREVGDAGVGVLGRDRQSLGDPALDRVDAGALADARQHPVERHHAGRERVGDQTREPDRVGPDRGRRLLEDRAQDRQQIAEGGRRRARHRREGGDDRRAVGRRLERRRRREVELERDRGRALRRRDGELEDGAALGLGERVQGGGHAGEELRAAGREPLRGRREIGPARVVGGREERRGEARRLEEAQGEELRLPIAGGGDAEADLDPRREPRAPVVELREDGAALRDEHLAEPPRGGEDARRERVPGVELGVVDRRERRGREREVRGGGVARIGFPGRERLAARDPALEPVGADPPRGRRATAILLRQRQRHPGEPVADLQDVLARAAVERPEVGEERRRAGGQVAAVEPQGAQATHVEPAARLTGRSSRPSRRAPGGARDRRSASG